MGEPVKGMEHDDPKLTSEGIKQANSQEKPEATGQTAETQQPAVTKADDKTKGQTVSSDEMASKAREEAQKASFMKAAKIRIKKENPDFADDKVESLAMAAFQRAMADKASGRGNEANEEFVQPSSKADGGM